MAVMGVLAGMILCAGVIVVRTIMDDTIKSEEDIEKYLGLSTLSVIPDRKDYINGSGKKKSKRNDAGKSEKQARTTYTNAQAKAAMSRRDNKASKLRVELTDPRKSNYFYEEALKTAENKYPVCGSGY